jgi:tRNA G10  N-methylase Trm11
MVYKYFQKNNYEDFSSGRVILHKSKYPNYPVRLAGEIFCQCLEYTNKIKDLCIYDPCCGSAYMLTVLGFLFNKEIETIYASDISEEAINFAKNNLSLLSNYGIQNRRNTLVGLINKYNKESHMSALNSLNNLLQYIKHEIKTNTFIANGLNENELKNKRFCADIVITDVPYGNLAAWSNKINDPINILLDTIIPIINVNTIIAITHNKDQRINNNKFNKIKKQKVGIRIIEIMKLK